MMLLVAMNVIPHLWVQKIYSVTHCTEDPPTLFTLSDLHHLSPPHPSLTHLPLARKIDLHAMSLRV